MIKKILKLLALDEASLARNRSPPKELSIIRHYLGLSSPLAATLACYIDFFRLFVDLKGFVTFFLLLDLVTDDFSRVNFFLPFNNSFIADALQNHLHKYHHPR